VPTNKFVLTPSGELLLFLDGETLSFPAGNEMVCRLRPALLNGDWESVRRVLAGTQQGEDWRVTRDDVPLCTSPVTNGQLRCRHCASQGFCFSFLEDEDERG